jgi:hypothetical protein
MITLDSPHAACDPRLMESPRRAGSALQTIRNSASIRRDKLRCAGEFLQRNCYRSNYNRRALFAGATACFEMRVISKTCPSDIAHGKGRSPLLGPRNGICPVRLRHSPSCNARSSTIEEKKTDPYTHKPAKAAIRIRLSTLPRGK